MATGILPGTGSAISMGKVQQAYNSVTAGTGADAPTGSINVKLSDVLGPQAPQGGVSPGTPIRFSSTFGGTTTPFEYPP